MSLEISDSTFLSEMVKKENHEQTMQKIKTRYVFVIVFAIACIAPLERYTAHNMT